MSTFKTTALILSKRPLKDADRLYVLYTPDYGKIEAKVRSAASTKSKLAGQVEPIAFARLMIAKSKGFETIAGAQLVKPYYFFGELSQSMAALTAELVNKCIRPGLSDSRIFQLLKDFLELLGRLPANSPKLRLFALRFIWQFISLLGYRFNPQEEQFSGLPALSVKTKALLSDCLKARSQLTILQSSSTVISELAVFTRCFLRYFFESDLNSYQYIYGEKF